jgi:hypothetical protein
LANDGWTEIIKAKKEFEVVLWKDPKPV